MSYNVFKNCNLPKGKNYIQLRKETLWKSNEKTSNFINFITNYTKQNDSILSNELYYQSEYKSLFPGYEFDLLMNSLYDFAINYANQNNLKSQNPGNVYYFKIDNEFYSIGVTHNYGVYVKFSHVNNFNNSMYIDLDLAMQNI